MVRAIKRLNPLQVISLIGLVVVDILWLLNVKGMKDLFYVVLGLNILGHLLFTMKWTREGKTNFSKLDKKYSKNLTRKPSETIFFSCVALYLLVCLMVVMGTIFKFQPSDYIPALTICAFIVNISSLIVVERTYREVVALIKKK